MKKKTQIIHIQEDEAYLQGINLVTGMKINYDRPVLTQNELNALCINQKYNKRQKAVKILKSGQALQKWSLFQNLKHYLHTPQQYEQILHLIEKYFQDLEQLFDIIAVGLNDCILQIKQSIINNSNINKKSFHLSDKAERTLFRLLIRSFTDQKYNKRALQSWSVLFQSFFNYLEAIKSAQTSQMVQECLQYISGSFSMNTPPDRRRIAFQMMKGLIKHSQKIRERAKTKASFFNNDTNSKTRSVICQVMGKILDLEPADQEIRKFILDYFHDSDFVVKKKAFQTLVHIQNQKHLQAIFDSVIQNQNQTVTNLIENMQLFLNKFSSFIKQSKRYKMALLNLVNSQLKSSQIYKICKLFPFLLKIYKIVQDFHQNSFLDTFVFDFIDFENQQVFKSLIQFYNNLSQIHEDTQVQRTLLFYIQKNIKSQKHRNGLTKNIKNLKIYLSVFTYDSQEQINIYISLLIKMIQESKWSQIQLLLQQLNKIIISQTNFQKISNCLVKLILHSPYFLVQEISKAILFLLLSKRKHLQFFLSLKEKLVTSKNWIHRKNYIVLYAQVKDGSSHQFHKIIPVLNYKLITKQKAPGVKFQFLKYAKQIYQSIDPISATQKNSLKQAIIQLRNQKDQDLSSFAKLVLQKITNFDIDDFQIEKIAQRNSVFMQQEQKLRQKEALNIKKNKTQKDLGRKSSKSKTIVGESRTSLRIPKDITKQVQKKQITIVNVQKLKRPSTVISSKRSITKSQQQRKQVSTNGPVLIRYMSGQMKNGAKVSGLRRQSGFKK